MNQFENHYVVGVMRTCSKIMSLSEQRDALTDAGADHIWRLGEYTGEDVMVTFHREDDDGEKMPAVLVTPFLAVLGNDRVHIVETLAKLDQPLYDLREGRFMDLRGGEDITAIERACNRQRGRHASAHAKNQGRKSLLDKDQWKTVFGWWSDPVSTKTNEEIADDVNDKYGVTISAPAISNKFGPRGDCKRAEIERQKRNKDFRI
jgi:hypothetical protein